MKTLFTQRPACLNKNWFKDYDSRPEKRMGEKYREKDMENISGLNLSGREYQKERERKGNKENGGDHSAKPFFMLYCVCLCRRFFFF